jgi:hypothetical protein
MSMRERILIELLAPPFLAVLWLAADALINKSEAIGDVIMGCFPVAFFAYLFSIIPSLIYTLVMEVWFRSGLGTRFGLFCTAALSSLLGTGAGLLACAIGTSLGPLIGEESRNFALMGAGIGLLVGLYVGRKQTSDNQKSAAS